MQNARQAGIKIARRNINNLRYVDDTTLMAENEEELKSLLMKVKEENKKAGLKLNIQKTMKCSLGISNFLEEISSLSHSVLFLSFFALITEESILVSPCYSLELCIQVHISFVYSFAFASLLFTAICKVSSDNCFAFLHFFFLKVILITASCTMFSFIAFSRMLCTEIKQYVTFQNGFFYLVI